MKVSDREPSEQLASETSLHVYIVEDKMNTEEWKLIFLSVSPPFS